MKKLILPLLLLCLLAAGCGTQNDVPDDAVATPKVYKAYELLGLTGTEIVAIYGEDYTAVTPEGDPPYFYYEQLGHVPYRFIGKPTDDIIQAVASDAEGSEMLDTICVGDSYDSLEAAATALEGYTFSAPATWYDDGFGTYGWAHVRGENEQYVCYILDGVLASYECRAMN